MICIRNLMFSLETRRYRSIEKIRSSGSEPKRVACNFNNSARTETKLHRVTATYKINIKRESFFFRGGNFFFVNFRVLKKLRC